MTRFAALGVRKMFTKLLKLATKHQKAEDWFEVNGNWVPVSPMEWRDQFTMSINVGLGHGTKEQQMARLMAMFPLQQAGLAVGVVGPQHIGHTIQDSLRQIAVWQTGMFQPTDMQEAFAAKSEKREPVFDDLLPLEDAI